MQEILNHFDLLDIYALVWFAICWIGYSMIADHTPLERRSVSAAMAVYRRQWMVQMMRRDMRMFDAQLHGNLLHGIGFFATTTILAIGGLLALLGSTDEALRVLEDLPFTTSSSRSVWEVKVLLLVLIFIYAFFKFAWAFRLANWNSILFGAAPVMENADENNEYVERATRINRLSSSNFNRGVRAYFFALAGLSWFLDSRLFMVASALVLLILINREFRARIVAKI